MSHVAVILTSERCGHCKHMRGTGRLLSQNEIKKDNKPASIQGGYHFDSKFMKKLITADSGTNTQHFRVVNIHYKTFNPAEGLMDISIFTLENDNTNVRQTVIKEAPGGKTQITIYLVAESGRVLSSEEIPTKWEEIVKTYVPVNIQNYALFYPSMVVFEKDAWTKGILNRSPIYGILNGFDSRKEAPYGAIPAQRPDVLEFPKFLNQFVNGTKVLSGVPVEEVKEKVKEEPIVVPTIEDRKAEPVIPTVGAMKKFRLYVVEK
jgi:hypothetical protein